MSDKPTRIQLDIPQELDTTQYLGPTSKNLEGSTNITIESINCLCIVDLLKESTQTIDVTLRHVLRFVLVKFQVNFIIEGQESTQTCYLNLGQFILRVKNYYECLCDYFEKNIRCIEPKTQEVNILLHLLDVVLQSKPSSWVKPFAYFKRTFTRCDYQMQPDDEIVYRQPFDADDYYIFCDFRDVNHTLGFTDKETFEKTIEIPDNKPIRQEDCQAVQSIYQSVSESQQIRINDVVYAWKNIIKLINLYPNDRNYGYIRNSVMQSDINKKSQSQKKQQDGDNQDSSQHKKQDNKDKEELKELNGQIIFPTTNQDNDMETEVTANMVQESQQLVSNTITSTNSMNQTSRSIQENQHSNQIDITNSRQQQQQLNQQDLQNQGSEQIRRGRYYSFSGINQQQNKQILGRGQNNLSEDRSRNSYNKSQNSYSDVQYNSNDFNKSDISHCIIKDSTSSQKQKQAENYFIENFCESDDDDKGKDMIKSSSKSQQKQQHMGSPAQPSSDNQSKQKEPIKFGSINYNSQKSLDIQNDQLSFLLEKSPNINQEQLQNQNPSQDLQKQSQQQQKLQSVEDITYYIKEVNYKYIWNASDDETLKRLLKGFENFLQFLLQSQDVKVNYAHLVQLVTEGVVTMSQPLMKIYLKFYNENLVEIYKQISKREQQLQKQKKWEDTIRSQQIHIIEDDDNAKEYVENYSQILNVHEDQSVIFMDQQQQKRKNSNVEMINEDDVNQVFDAMEEDSDINNNLKKISAFYNTPLWDHYEEIENELQITQDFDIITEIESLVQQNNKNIKQSPDFIEDNI